MQLKPDAAAENNEKKFDMHKFYLSSVIRSGKTAAIDTQKCTCTIILKYFCDVMNYSMC